MRGYESVLNKLKIRFPNNYEAKLRGGRENNLVLSIPQRKKCLRNQNNALCTICEGPGLETVFPRNIVLPPASEIGKVYPTPCDITLTEIREGLIKVLARK